MKIFKAIAADDTVCRIYFSWDDSLVADAILEMEREVYKEEFGEIVDEVMPFVSVQEVILSFGPTMRDVELLQNIGLETIEI